MNERQTQPDLRARMRAALTTAMKQRDAIAVSALRSALAAIDNAEAVDASYAPPAAPSSARVAGAVGGLGAGEVARRVLSSDEIAAIVAAEAQQRRDAAAEYDRLGAPDEAARLRTEAGVLARMLDGAS